MSWEILEPPEKIAAAKGIQLIVCIDEFQQLALLPGYKSMEGKMRFLPGSSSNVFLLFLRKQAAYDDGHLQQFVNPFYRFGPSAVPAKDTERGMGTLHRQCLPPDEQRNQRTAQAGTTVRHR